jgi:hypothetical protein
MSTRVTRLKPGTLKKFEDISANTRSPYSMLYYTALKMAKKLEFKIEQMAARYKAGAEKKDVK